MAITLATGTGQALSVPTLTPKAPSLATYAYSKDVPGEAIYTNVVGALDQPNSLRHGVTSVADVFRNTPVTANADQRRDGLSLLTQVNEVWKVYDNADNSVLPYYLPVSAHVVLKLPTDANITAAIVRDLMLRLIGSPCRNGTDAYDVAIGPWVHGITRL